MNCSNCFSSPRSVRPPVSAGGGSGRADRSGITHADGAPEPTAPATGRSADGQRVRWPYTGRRAVPAGCRVSTQAGLHYPWRADFEAYSGRLGEAPTAPGTPDLPLFSPPSSPLRAARLPRYPGIRICKNSKTCRSRRPAPEIELSRWIELMFRRRCPHDSTEPG